MSYQKNPNNAILQQLYESPMTAGNALNDSANASITYGGCFNNNSSVWNPSRLVTSTPTRTRGYRNYGNTPHPQKMSNWRGNGTDRRQAHPNNNHNISNNISNDSVRLRLVDFDDSSFGTASSAAASTMANFSRLSLKTTLPAWAADNEGGVAPSVTLDDVLSKNALFEFAADKNGCRFLQEQYPTLADGGIHDIVFNKIVEKREVFLSMCRNMFGNFFLQRIVECSNAAEQKIVTDHLESDIYSLCLDKSACRVIQLAIQMLDANLASRLVQKLRGTNLVRASIDQNGNHVIQKIVKTLPVASWDFIVDFFNDDENLIAVCEDKYGCRVIQSTIEKLSEKSDSPQEQLFDQKLVLLHSLMGGITRNCAQLASNEFANYVVQYVIKTGGTMEIYRDLIIEKCLLRNLLSMSQEKYASHVVEVAFLHAPHHLIHEMMEEIFEGYLPHPETNRDALDILLFHQYGNYIIQQMITICCSAIFEQKERGLTDNEVEQYTNWLDRIKDRVFRNTSRLERFSSGKRIIEALHRSYPAKIC